MIKAFIKNEIQGIISKYHLAKYNQGTQGDAPQFSSNFIGQL